jgi:hypothetical protein
MSPGPGPDNPRHDAELTLAEGPVAADNRGMPSGVGVESAALQAPEQSDAVRRLVRGDRDEPGREHLDASVGGLDPDFISSGFDRHSLFDGNGNEPFESRLESTPRSKAVDTPAKSGRAFAGFRAGNDAMSYTDPARLLDWHGRFGSHHRVFPVDSTAPWLRQSPYQILDAALNVNRDLRIDIPVT